jgi:hypothetical protein
LGQRYGGTPNNDNAWKRPYGNSVFNLQAGHGVNIAAEDHAQDLNFTNTNHCDEFCNLSYHWHIIAGLDQDTPLQSTLVMPFDSAANTDQPGGAPADPITETGAEIGILLPPPP